MKTNWKSIKFGLMLLALPLVGTAAATAHQLMVDTKPMTLEFETTVSNASAIGLARTHTVALNRNGAVEGQIATIGNGSTAGISDLKVYFVQNGEVVTEADTDENGAFVAAGVPEGAYSFVATGQNGFAAYGIRVVSDDSGKFDNVMEAAAVSPRFATVKRILNEKLPKEVADQIISTSISDAKVVGSNRVKLDNGQLQGSVVSLLGESNSVNGTSVHIIKNDEQVAEVLTDETGEFVVSDLESGVYDFVAAGPNGFAAVSFEAVQDSTVVTASAAVVVESDAASAVADPITYQDSIPVDIPYGAGYSDSLNVCMTNTQDTGFINNQVPAEIGYVDGMSYDCPVEYASEAIGCGSAVGGCCGSAANFSGFSCCNPGGGGPFGGGRFGRLGGGGGAGGGFFGSGIGRLAMLGGLAVGIVAISDNDSDPISGS